MADALLNIVTAEPRSRSFRLPRPMWIGLATIVLAAVGVKIGVPIDRRHAAIREIERLRDPKLPMDERKAIAIAMSYFADENGGRPIDAEFSATRQPDGFHVLVIFVVERDFIGQARFMPGGHSTVRISNEGKVLDVRGGL